jgi:hypothetical protein
VIVLLGYDIRQPAPCPTHRPGSGWAARIDGPAGRDSREINPNGNRARLLVGVDPVMSVRSSQSSGRSIRAGWDDGLR